MTTTTPLLDCLSFNKISKVRILKKNTNYQLRTRLYKREGRSQDSFVCIVNGHICLRNLKIFYRQRSSLPRETLTTQKLIETKVPELLGSLDVRNRLDSLLTFVVRETNYQLSGQHWVVSYSIFSKD